MSASGEGARKHDHRGSDYAHLLHVPPRMQTSSSRIAAQYTFDTRWACRKRWSKKVRVALDAARRRDRSRRITLRRMWCCFPEAVPFPILHDGEEESKIRASSMARRLYQPEHLKDQQEPTRAATIERCALIPATSPSHMHSANLAAILPLLSPSWAIPTFVHRSPFQRLAGQPLDKRSLGGLLNVAR
jgi:hypothetical protein